MKKIDLMHAIYGVDAKGSKDKPGDEQLPGQIRMEV